MIKILSVKNLKEGYDGLFPNNIIPITRGSSKTSVLPKPDGKWIVADEFCTGYNIKSFVDLYYVDYFISDEELDDDKGLLLLNWWVEHGKQLFKYKSFYGLYTELQGEEYVRRDN